VKRRAPNRDGKEEAHQKPGKVANVVTHKEIPQHDIESRPVGVKNVRKAPSYGNRTNFKVGKFKNMQPRRVN